MKILLEGADCSGKTTLAEALRKVLPDFKYVHHTHETNSIAEFLETLRRRENLIIDRLWLSEAIYGPIMRNGSKDPDGVVAAHWFCHHDHYMILCVRKDVDGHIQHFLSQTRDEYVKDPAKIEAIIRRYYELTFHGNDDWMAFNLRNRVLVYDMDVHTPEDFVAAFVRGLAL